MYLKSKISVRVSAFFVIEVNVVVVVVFFSVTDVALLLYNM